MTTHFHKTSEPLWWSLFSAGGVMSALFLPAFVVTSGFLLPWLRGHDHEGAYEQVVATVTWWPVRLGLMAVIGLSFFHAAHRIRHVVIDLGWRHATAPLSIACYGAAIAGVGATVYLLLAL